MRRREVEGEGGQRIQHTVVAHVLAVKGFDTDDAHHHFGGHAIGLFGTGEGALVGLPKLGARFDATAFDEALAVSAPVFGGGYRRRHDHLGDAFEVLCLADLFAHPCLG